MKKVTVRMVGAAAGVSHATVSRVLNNDPRVHPATRAEVIAAARRLGYPLAPADGRSYRVYAVDTAGKRMGEVKSISPDISAVCSPFCSTRYPVTVTGWSLSPARIWNF